MSSEIAKVEAQILELTKQLAELQSTRCLAEYQGVSGCKTTLR